MTPRGATVLVVEDEFIIARDLEARLVTMGYEVVGIASSGPEALATLAATQPDLVLMDIVLKGDMDGIDTAAQIRRRWHVPVIFLTAYTDQQTLERAKVTEPYGYIVKPFSERELHANIQMVLYRHASESRMRRVERFFASAVDDLFDAVLAADGNQTITLFNPAAEEITGWSRSEAIGRSLGDVFRLVRRTTKEPIALGSAVVEGPVVCFADDTLLLNRTGRYVPIDSTTTCLRDPDDIPVGTISVFRDRSHERHGEIAMLSSDIAEATAESVSIRAMLQRCAEALVRRLDLALAGIWILNAAGDLLILQASAALEADASAGTGAEASGVEAAMPRRIALGAGQLGRIAQERLPAIIDLRDATSAAERQWAVRERIVACAGYPLLVENRLLGVMAAYLRESLPPGASTALSSTARTIAVGVERKRLWEHVRESEKMEALGHLAGGVAHDFNNLLTVVAGCSQVLLERQDLDPPFRDLLVEISKAGERGTALTRQLLAFSRKQEHDQRPLDVATLVADLEKLLRRVIGEHVRFTTALARPAPPIVADAGQLEQALVNLAINARDAMPTGGTLSIETRAVDLTTSRALTHGTATPGSYVVVIVSDTGTGMPVEIMDHMFEPFFTTKEPGRGTGLGLAMVYGIVQQSRGLINVFSEVGVGTTFELFFPAAPRSSGPLQATDATRSSGGPGTETILVVEDEAPVRVLLRLALESYGYTVLEAALPSEALRIAREYEGAIQLLITDVVMPEMGGPALAERFAVLRSSCRVLYISGYPAHMTVQGPTLRPDAAFLQKPFSPRALVQKAREVLDR